MKNWDWLGALLVFLVVLAVSFPIYLVLSGGHSGFHGALTENLVLTVLFFPVAIFNGLLNDTGGLIWTDSWVSAWFAVGIPNGIGYALLYLLMLRWRDWRRGGQEKQSG